MAEFYAPNKILSIKDKNGNVPRVRMIVGNRTAGKTFSVKRILVKRFLEKKQKFICLVRHIDDLPNFTAGFWADIGPLKFPGHDMTQTPLLNGHAQQLELDGKPCGYVIAINDAERIKRNSAMFADADVAFLDEFVSETGRYVPKEIEKMDTITISVARGGKTGKHVRHFELWLCSNNVTAFNPYFDRYRVLEAGLTNRTRFLRGNGWVLEQVLNTAAAQAIRSAYGDTMPEDFIKYAAENKFLLDNKTFVKKMPGQKYPLLTIKFYNKKFGVWVLEDNSTVYISKKVDPSKDVFAVTYDDHQEDTKLATRTNQTMKTLRSFYETGDMLFDSGASKNAFLSACALIPNK